jgi:hypothetical protein
MLFRSRNVLPCNLFLAAGLGILSTLIPAAAHASQTASATISSSPVGGGVFQYNIALTNTSTDGSPIGTFWFSWIPGVDYMQAQPTNITMPTGWTDSITGSNNSTDGNAIRYVAGAGSQLNQGGTDDFSFESTETLAQLESHSPFGNNAIETTSVVYQGAPLIGTAFTFAVPEPASMTLITLSGAAALLRRRRSNLAI